MRKQELIHLHGLTVELRRHLEEHSELPVESYIVDDADGPGPMAIHRRKGVHKAAVRRSLGDIVAALETSAEPMGERSAEQLEARD